MSASDFFNRWSRRKNEASNPDASPSTLSARSTDTAASDHAPKVAPNVASHVAPDMATSAPMPASSIADNAEQKPLPTLADVEKLTPDSDYSAFLAKGVDENVKRSALKKLFADPHFNVMDGLDTYIDDYTKPDPIPPAMLAALNHAKDLLDPLRVSSSPGKPFMALLNSTSDKTEQPESQPPAAREAAAATTPVTTVAVAATEGNPDDASFVDTSSDAADPMDDSHDN